MTRVQIPAYTDRWMMGDRTGEIVKTSHSPAHALATPELRELAYMKVENYWDKVEIAHVKLDRSSKIVRVILADCEVVS